ncbi:nuclear transport factor 2 family protein [Rhizobium sp. BE258]|jgi:ketosteroid isomerase-like protein|uniref:nuclear transport factor 2 family protein n=1 Tax=Rhizobium sp. BE258 TaxID=2817722 RepID=UPI0028624A7E|nr:nuclear transport factor 2 family protein [Rhizobium sp. BE258]MDR7144780.1 ketosteroid isomerase-like protein [Rhizobium sp. BE258]
MTTNTELTPAQVVQHYLDTFFKKDVEKTLQCLTEDVIWKVQGAADVPTIGLRRGRDQVREWMALFPVNFEPLEFHIERTFESGDQVVIIGHFKHRIRSSGKEFASDFAAICSVRDGKVSAYNFIEDSYALWRAFQAK